jgi:hypothetical protein
MHRDVAWVERACEELQRCAAAAPLPTVEQEDRAPAMDELRQLHGR